MTSTSKSRRNPCASARKFCKATCAKKGQQKNKRGCPVQALRERGFSNVEEAGSQARTQTENVPGPVQLRHNFRRRRELRPSGNGVGKILKMSRLRQASRSQKPPAANGLSTRKILVRGRVLTAQPRSHSALRRLTSLKSQTCYTASAFDCSPSPASQHAQPASAPPPK
jgi:hypothetical protein